MTKTIFSIFSTIALLCVGSSGLAEYRNMYGETFQQQQNREELEDRIQYLERRQRQRQDPYQHNFPPTF